MKLWSCCCGWSYIIGSKQVYGAIYPMGIGTYPNAISPTARMRTRQEFEEDYSDCADCYAGAHHHDRS